jgi:hypothetical protein
MKNLSLTKCQDLSKKLTLLFIKSLPVKKPQVYINLKVNRNKIKFLTNKRLFFIPIIY